MNKLQIIAITAAMALVACDSKNVKPLIGGIRNAEETIEKIKNLVPGTAITFGTAFKIPLIAKLDLPDPMPESTSVDVSNRWFSE